MDDLHYMRRALELAARGRGRVEPNPMVGCVIVRDGQVVGEGWHQAFGGDHAEVEALRQAGQAARDATMYVTLEPCCHDGQTPACAPAIIRAGLRRVVIAMQDPFPLVDGQGVHQLRQAGIEVDVGLLEQEARDLNAPFVKLIRHFCPWIIAKWAMTLDGKIATTSGESRWISGKASRRLVHELRGRVDAIVVGRNTVLADDPLLTACPPGPRPATRIVLDSLAQVPLSSQLVRTAAEHETLILVGPEADAERCAQLAAAGCEVFMAQAATYAERMVELLEELAGRRMTNVLVEGGARVLGCLMELGQIDEVHAFIAGKLIGGQAAPTAVAGTGIASLADALRLERIETRQIEDDVYITGRVRRTDDWWQSAGLGPQGG